jgi:gamma-glutamyltranspeptidase/glutathione hydrolase
MRYRLLKKLSVLIALFALNYFTQVVAQTAPTIPLLPPTADLPEPASVIMAKPVSMGKRYMVAAAHPLAAEAGAAMLAMGGSAIDAAVAVQMVLNVVEPQSSGIGGGAFILYFDAARKLTVTYDGREAAPMAATAQLFLGADGKPIRYQDAVRSGRSVGVPGVLKSLEAAHARYGKLAWRTLFQPAIRLAEGGYPLSARTMQQASNSQRLRDNPATRIIFFNDDGSPKAVGTLTKNSQLAATFKRIANQGTDAFYTGVLANEMVTAVHSHLQPGFLTLADLVDYRARISQPVCGDYRRHQVCGMPMPSSGGVAVVQILGALERFDMGALKPSEAEAIHLFSEAGRLAYADREKFAADDKYVDVPVAALISRAYIDKRSQLIQAGKTMGRANAGTLIPAHTSLGIDDGMSSKKLTGTSHFSIVDAAGNAVSVSTSVESSFGSQIFVGGFFLNNQLTDFSFTPTDAVGNAIANAVAPGKRPRSAMSPTFVFNEDGTFKMAVGSALGSTIINQVAKTIVGVIDWRLDIQAAIALPNVGSRNGPTDIEKNTPAEKAVPALKAMGHEVRVTEVPGGLHGVLRGDAGWQGGVDPRREGAARGQ